MMIKPQFSPHIKGLKTKQKKISFWACITDFIVLNYWDVDKNTKNKKQNKTKAPKQNTWQNTPFMKIFLNAAQSSFYYYFSLYTMGILRRHWPELEFLIHGFVIFIKGGPIFILLLFFSLQEGILSVTGQNWNFLYMGLG